MSTEFDYGTGRRKTATAPACTPEAATLKSMGGVWKIIFRAKPSR